MQRYCAQGLMSTSWLDLGADATMLLPHSIASHGSQDWSACPRPQSTDISDKHLLDIKYSALDLALKRARA